jgi:hypothetical protein
MGSLIKTRRPPKLAITALTKTPSPPKYSRSLISVMDEPAAMDAMAYEPAAVIGAAALPNITAGGATVAAFDSETIHAVWMVVSALAAIAMVQYHVILRYKGILQYSPKSTLGESPTPKPAFVRPETAAVHRHILLKLKGDVPSEATAAAAALETLVAGVIRSELTPITDSAQAKGFTHRHLVVLGSTDALAAYDAHAAPKALRSQHLDALMLDELTYEVVGIVGGKLAGKTALITGSSSGIGKDVALAFAREGCDVVLNYPSGDEKQAANAADVAREVGLLGRRAVVAAADITSASEVEAMVKLALASYGQIDILVNNAGMASSAPVQEMPEDMVRDGRSNSHPHRTRTQRGSRCSANVPCSILRSRSGTR